MCIYDGCRWVNVGGFWELHEYYKVFNYPVLIIDGKLNLSRWAGTWDKDLSNEKYKKIILSLQEEGIPFWSGYACWKYFFDAYPCRREVIESILGDEI